MDRSLIVMGSSEKNEENVYAQLFLYVLLERVAKTTDDTW